MPVFEDTLPYPAELAEWQRALQGCAALYEQAADYLRAEPPQLFEAARCIRVAARAGAKLQPQVAMAYALSEQAVDDLLSGPAPSTDYGHVC